MYPAAQEGEESEQVTTEELVASAALNPEVQLGRVLLQLIRVDVVASATLNPLIQLGDILPHETRLETVADANRYIPPLQDGADSEHERMEERVAMAVK